MYDMAEVEINSLLPGAPSRSIYSSGSILPSIYERARAAAAGATLYNVLVRILS